MKFIETRGNDNQKPSSVSFSEAILSPSASFGGLYVPQELPCIDENFIKSYMDKSYKDLAYDLMKLYGIDIDDSDLKDAIDLYDKYDDVSNPVPVVKVKDELFVNELYHGPTRAFKDMALQPFGHILSALAKKKGENYLIMAATSGDTGPAALEGFKNKPFIKVVCLYPDGGTSDVQRLQMVTEDGTNQKVIGIKGNFDDAQNALKSLLACSDFNEELKNENIKLSAANSVNFGRIIFQTVYHFWSYISLLKQNEIEYGEKIYLTVPSGNFGNALGGYYAKKMGLPIEKILITSNENNILTELIQEGRYDLRDKELIMTKSPAMDILKSSNVERILFDMFGSERTKELMTNLEKENHYELTKDELAKLQEEFSASFSDDEYGKETIKAYLENDKYLMDPHTATCIKAHEELRKKSLKNVIYSTAEWTKFSPTVVEALEGNGTKYADTQALDIVSKKYNAKIPTVVENIFSKEIKHSLIIDKDNIKEEITKFIRS
jgi:threonine synthase